MEENIKLLLLKIIEKKNEASYLEQLGYSYSDIAACLSDMISEGYIEADEEYNYVLSDSGYDKLKEMEDDFRRKGVVLLQPFANYRIDKISKYDIFIE